MSIDPRRLGFLPEDGNECIIRNVVVNENWEMNKLQKENHSSSACVHLKSVTMPIVRLLLLC
jgi:hypothetical protein